MNGFEHYGKVKEIGDKVKACTITSCDVHFEVLKGNIAKFEISYCVVKSHLKMKICKENYEMH
jgi:hypothetical protein